MCHFLIHGSGMHWVRACTVPTGHGCQLAVLLVTVAHVGMAGYVPCSGAHFIGMRIATHSFGCSACRLQCIDFKGLRLCHNDIYRFAQNDQLEVCPGASCSYAKLGFVGPMCTSHDKATCVSSFFSYMMRGHEDPDEFQDRLSLSHIPECFCPSSTHAVSTPNKYSYR